MCLILLRVICRLQKVVEMDSERCCCSITNPNDASAPAKIFTFDGVYDAPATTEQIYNEAAYPLVEVSKNFSLEQLDFLFYAFIFLNNIFFSNILFLLSHLGWY